MRALTFHDFVALIGDRFGKFDVPCPLCASLYNPRKKVLRIWRETESFLGYHCARCGESGWARDGGSIARPSPEHLAAVRQEATARDAQERADSLRKAQGLWSQRQPVEAVSAAWVYVRDFRAYQGPIPPTLGALPASTKYPPALIAAFGFAIEPGFADGPEPGVLTISDDAIHGVHLIQLQADGRDRLRTPDAKKSIGRGSTGTPIILAPMNDLLGLIVTEGIENGLTLYEATGCGVWVSGGASRLPALAAAVPDWTDCITVWADDDPDGLRHARELRNRLAARGLTVELKLLTERRAVA